MSTFTGGWDQEMKVAEVKTFPVQEGDKTYIHHLMTFKNGSQLNLHGKYGKKPEVGDRINLRLKPGTTRVRGIMLNDEVVWNHSDEEDLALMKQEEADNITAMKAKFEAEKETLDKWYEKFPEPVKMKINRLRSNNPDFRWKYEAYEMFICREALKVINHLKSIRKIESFIEANDKFKPKLIPNLRYKAYNQTPGTMAKVCAYAHYLATNPRLFHFQHGALVEVVGCKEYGCPPVTDDELKEMGIDPGLFKKDNGLGNRQFQDRNIEISNGQNQPNDNR